MTVSALQRLALDSLPLESGASLRAELAYVTHGTLAPDRDNVVLVPSYYTGTHDSYLPWIGPGGFLDTDRWFVVVVNMLGNGVSTSPSNAPEPWAGPRFPTVTVADQVDAQALLLEHLGIDRLRLVMGWSMGAMQAYEWAASRPDRVDALLPICGAARCSPHNHVFLEGVRAALRADPAFADGQYAEPPVAGLRAFGRGYAGWAYSRDFFHDGAFRDLGYADVEHVLEDWAQDHAARDANDLLAMMDTWQSGDVGRDRGGYESALAAVSARTIVMPSTTDLYFTVADSAVEASLVPGAELRPLASDLGHVAGRPGVRAAETAFIARAVRDLLGDG
ncbi:alpha/beta fold hydrolase [Aeromicrobium sp. 636]|uniref:Alpha/beta fold hydrolase n=1 Tax=Aeromicrobium senzhongii TaxID=2663859 RepID=A0A8I0K1A6_9ACTN|nr:MULTISPECIES: alpha/beta fold hydrolase [Aeromicrobium]MBC9227271.1 alpha/beta fold hydrolase [Aeromicrobium senzhongii]MCQ3999369.1 alpha/beta fold hydrolase [Aeromicrobium sp. 636]